MSGTISLSGTVTAFAPTQGAVFSFTAVLDGASCSVRVPWNVYRGGGGLYAGWYVRVYTQANALVVSTPLIGSPPYPRRGVDLVAGYFSASSLYYYPASGAFLVTP